MMDKELTRVASVSPPVVGGAVLLEDMLFILFLQPLCICPSCPFLLHYVLIMEKRSMSPKWRVILGEELY
jgi:hypothetical protein